MNFIKFSHFPNMQGISYDFIGFHENRWDAAAGGATGGHPGTEYMDVPGTQEFIGSAGYPPESMNSLVPSTSMYWVLMTRRGHHGISFLSAAERTLVVFKEFPGSQRRKMTLIRTSARSAAPRRGRRRKRETCFHKMKNVKRAVFLAECGMFQFFCNFGKT